MKSETIGFSIGYQVPNSKYIFPDKRTKLSMTAAWTQYLADRCNGPSIVGSLPPAACDREIARCNYWVREPGKADYWRIAFKEGPVTKALMEAQDRKYLSEIAISDPALFLKEMTPRSELGREDQNRKLGLDLSLPHHRDLQREYAPIVARVIRGEKSVIAPVTALASPAVVRSGGSGGGSSSSSEIWMRAEAARKEEMTRMTRRIASLNDSDYFVRRGAIQALTAMAVNDDSNCKVIRRAGAILPLVRLLGSDNRYEGSEAARALGFLVATSEPDGIREAGAIPLLVGLSNDSNSDVKREAEFALFMLAFNPANTAAIEAAKGIGAASKPGESSSGIYASSFAPWAPTIRTSRDDDEAAEKAKAAERAAQVALEEERAKAALREAEIKAAEERVRCATTDHEKWQAQCDVNSVNQRHRDEDAPGCCVM